jgi:lipopolysaccharide export system protein LptA
MPVFIARLRHWFAGGTIAVILIVAGVHFHSRHRLQNALQQVPEKIGLEIQQSATGFTISKSEQGRTLFKVDASKAVQFKEGGRVELHEVVITVYGRDSDRYDRIYGSDFEFNQQSGDVAAQGEVQIDLQANPEGVVNPDQSPPKDLKNPIHLKTRGLVFNQKSGNAHTHEKVEFQLPQASGSGVGMNYVAKSNVLTLENKVKLVSANAAGPTLTAARAVVTKDPHQVVLEHPQLETVGRKCESGTATLFLRPDNTLDHVLASGNVLMQVTVPQAAEAHAEQLELTMSKQRGTLRTAVFSGSVTGQVSGDQPIHANAGRVELDFVGNNILTKVRAEDAVKLSQQQKPGSNSTVQNLDLTAAIIDFFLTNGNLSRAQTSGAARIALVPVSTGAGPQTLATAGQFQARFNDAGQITSLHGSPDARIVSRNSGQPDRVSTSQTLDASFLPTGGIDSIVQEGNVAYEDGERNAFGSRAVYTPADQVLILTGSPRVIERGMTTTAHSMRLKRASGEAFAEGDVKTTYSDLKPEPNGALLASSSPIHVTADSMSVAGTAAVALYTGSVKLWQDANMVEARSIEFDRERRSMIARGTPERLVSTILIENNKAGEPTPIAITSSRLTYTDGERRVHFDGNVTAKGLDVTITARQIDAFLQAHGQSTPSQSSSAAKIDKIVAAGQVIVIQPGRRATGDQLVYAAAEDKFVMTGGPPSIFDAEHGKITGVSLTFFRRDDRVFIEGNNKFPTVTQTRVAR